MNINTITRCLSIASFSGCAILSSFNWLNDRAIPKNTSEGKFFHVTINEGPESSFPVLTKIDEWPGSTGLYRVLYGIDKPVSAPNATLNYASDPTNYFRSRNTGGWIDVNTWESSTDNLTWTNATLIPTAFAQGIFISNGHVVNLGGDVSAKSLTISPGGILTNPGPGGGYLLTIEKDPNSPEAEFIIYGTYLLFGKQPVFLNGSTARVYGNALVRAEDNVGGGSDAFASNASVYFEDKAVFEWNNNSPFATSGITYFPNAEASEIPVFKVSKDPGDVGTGSLIINGLLEVNTNFTFNGGSHKIFRNGITGNSTLTQNSTSNNRFTIGGEKAILGGTSLTLQLFYPMYLESPVTVPVDSLIIIEGANINNAKAGNIFTIEGTLDVTQVQITNTDGSVIIKGSYRTANTGSTDHELASVPAGIVTTLPGSTVEFYHSDDQSFKSRLDFTHIIFSGSGIKRASAGFDPSGTLTIKEQAILDSRGQNIGDTNTRLVMTDNSRLILSTTGQNPTMEGGYTLTGGVIQFDNSSDTKQTIRGTYGPEPGISIIYNQIEVTGTSVANSNGNINLREGGVFTVKKDGVFEINAKAIKADQGSSNQQVIVETGAIFKTGNEYGFHGTESVIIPIGVSSIHPNISNITLQPNSTIEYHRSSEIHASGLQTITTTIPYQHLVLSGNEEKKVSENGLLEIKGNVNKTSAALFQHNKSTVIFNGEAVQDYSCVAPQMIFNNLINQNSSGLHINDSLSLFKTLTLGNNSLININAEITLLSNAENTANVAPIPASAAISYTEPYGFIVERHITGTRKAWQFLSVPVYGDQTIHEAWQERSAPGMNPINNAPGAAGNVKSGFGTTLTSDRPTWSVDGFDRYTAPGPSLKTFNSAAGEWEGVSGTHISLQNEKGYMAMVRGDRSVIAHDQAATETILRSHGRIYSPANVPPAIIIPNTPGTFVPVGNPYASAIDFYSTTRTNLSESYIIWDPKLTNEPASSYGLGAFRTISGDVAVPSGGNYLDENLPPIQSSQAFFVQLADNATASGSLVFSENSKTSGSHSIFRNGPTLRKPTAQLRINLFARGKEKPVLLDGIITLLNEAYAARLDEWDAIKMLNPEENIGILSHTKTLAIERRPLFQLSDTLHYQLSGLRKQSYFLEFIHKNNEAGGLDTYVEDIYLNQKTLVGQDTTRLNFEVDNNPASYNKNRFRIIFQPAKGPLPVIIHDFSAAFQKQAITLTWIAVNESGLEKFVVESSKEGTAFQPLNERAAENKTKNKYQVTDASPIPGTHFYRLKMIYKNGDTAFSKTLKILVDGPDIAVVAYPNPIENGIIQVHFGKPFKGKIYYRITDAMGKIILEENIHSDKEIRTQTLNISSSPKGLYLLELILPGGEKRTLKINK